MNQYLLAFVTGLTSGGISCLTVQGGLLASAIDERSSKYKSTLYFILSKLVAYTILGALLGTIGSAFSFSITTQGILQILIGLFMLATAGRILNLHPIFRYTIIQPPAFILRKVRSISKERNIFTPIFLGALTVLIPCGVTQAMLILSMGTGSAIDGALIMFLFTLGTSPVFFLLGLTITNIFKHNILSKIAALTIIVIGLSAINNGQVLRDSPHTFQNYKRVVFGDNIQNGEVKIVDGYQIVEITATNSGYKANTKNLKAGIPVKLKISTKNVQSCARSFIIPSLGVNTLLPVSGEELIEFTPTEEGLLNFSCGMGMYTGSFNITE
ncbi:MAG: sulfite exporter TauE/SafE family protein [bacterium]|nr:MAG: sulfite exporter TauE/SafE family protein [bacterium]